MKINSDSAFVFSMMAGVIGIVIAGFSNGFAMLGGYIAYVVIFLGLLIADEKGLLGKKEVPADENVRKVHLRSSKR